MAEPIISPMYIYLIGVCGNLQSILIPLIASSAFACLLVPIPFLMDNEFYRIKKVFVVLITVLMVSCGLQVFVPTKETLITMIVAQSVTKENLKLTKEEVVSLIKEIATAVNSIEDKKHDK